MIISARFASMEWRILNQSHRQKMGSLPEGGELFPVFSCQAYDKNVQGTFFGSEYLRKMHLSCYNTARVV